ncbi:hypothetical protein TFKS16_0657 [Tannerella forsythia KS16]|uniref:Uncharacterized protein n=1 Tax=Tannerella forsythia (strain ATCC 43037 / JCM 10827 / CCUG 21028 A / KCTC 5666 / FDC 338) TaxID=203275 RepID=G8UMZ2_TANFA|nr:hypothetical protein BFO_0713 [Tannerella forsythia 92A2]BAR48256.1 hypothetical protein TF3313_0689 [Tannerella forsythia 3313]BAR50956.1 hypothetical protein TFKS16_0657 [Tannerella forsythia KS16]
MNAAIFDRQKEKTHHDATNFIKKKDFLINECLARSSALFVPWLLQ